MHIHKLWKAQSLGRSQKSPKNRLSLSEVAHQLFFPKAEQRHERSSERACGPNERKWPLTKDVAAPSQRNDASITFIKQELLEVFFQSINRRPINQSKDPSTTAGKASTMTIDPKWKLTTVFLQIMCSSLPSVFLQPQDKGMTCFKRSAYVFLRWYCQRENQDWLWKRTTRQKYSRNGSLDMQ